VLRSTLGFLAEKQFRQTDIRPRIPELVNAIAATFENGEDVQAWCNEVERGVRWYRVRGYWLAFLVQLATRARKSIWHVLACFRYAEAQVGLADDEALHSLETAYNSLRINRAAFGDSFEPLNAMVVRTLQVHHDYYSAWLRPFAYRECNPLADHLYSRLAYSALGSAFPEIPAPRGEADYLAVIGQCGAPEALYYRVVARRFLGLEYSGKERYEEAAEQFRLALEDALPAGLDTEIGHVRRLYGSALRTLGRLPEALRQFEQAYLHEQSDYCAYWRALTARELGDTLLRTAGTSQPLDSAGERVEVSSPQAMEPALNAYHDGRMFFDVHLQVQSPFPLTRAIKQEIFRSFSSNAIQSCFVAQHAADELAELEGSGPRAATEVVAEIAAAGEVPGVSVSEYRAARAALYKTLNTFPQRFEDYLASIAADYPKRQAYLQARISVAPLLARRLLGETVAKNALALRIPGAVFLMFHIGRRESFAVVLDAGSGEAAPFPAPFEEETIASIHNEYAAALRDAREADDQGLAGKAVARLLSRWEDLLCPVLEPLLPFLKDRRLKIFPRLQMNSVPLHALRFGSQYLMEHCEVSYGQTLGLLIETHSQAPEARDPAPLVVSSGGLPFYDGMLHAAALKNARVLTGAAWPQVLQFLESSAPRDVLFACHGEYHADQPQSSYLDLGGNVVSFSDLFADLDLRGCRSVMMGACESGLSRAEISAEYIGLTSALLASGVRYVVGALWQVSQLATPVLAERYFGYLADETTSVPAALRRAQLDLIGMDRATLAQWVTERMTPLYPELTPAILEQVAAMEERPFALPVFWAGMQAVGDI
jgi:CHAT domain-containing protein